MQSTLEVNQYKVDYSTMKIYAMGTMKAVYITLMWIKKLF